MFGRKGKPEEGETPKTEAEAGAREADDLAKSTLETLDKGLEVKRQAREKTSRFVGSLRPLVLKSSSG